MKYLLIFISFFSILVSSEINQHQIQILETIISKISIDKEIKIWSDDKGILQGLQNSSNIETTDSCLDSSIVILNSSNNLPIECSNKYIFVLNYNLLTEVKQSFGALFWKKGRPNIVIIESRIEKQNISVSKELEPYLEEKVW